MNIAVNLFPSLAYSFLRFTDLNFDKRSASRINPRFRWDKAVLLQLKEDNNRLRDGFVTRLHALG